MDPWTAAASAAGKIAGGALGEDATDRQALVTLAADHPAMLAAADAHARRVLIREQTWLKIAERLGRLAGVRAEYLANTFPEEMAAKTAHIPPDAFADPKPYLAVPAIQALGYSFDEPTLKEMYLNLLARASDQRVSAPHPSFVEVIRQLSPREAQLLPAILNSESTPMARVIAETPGVDGEIKLADHLISPDVVKTVAVIPFAPPVPAGAEILQQDEWALFVDNWTRLALAIVSYDGWLTSPGVYDWADSHPQLLAWRSGIQQFEIHNPSAPSRVVTFSRGTMSLTQFGKDFLSVVVDASDD